MRYADDVVAGFEHEGGRPSACWRNMRQRMAKFALSLHPDKTRLIEFGRFAATSVEHERGLGQTGGVQLSWFHAYQRADPQKGRFLHCNARARRDRMRAKIKSHQGRIATTHARPHPATGAVASGKWCAVTLHYHAVPTNLRSLAAFRYFRGAPLAEVRLRRRSQKDRHHVGLGSHDLADGIACPLRASFTHGRTPALPSHHPRWEPGA